MVTLKTFGSYSLALMNDSLRRFSNRFILLNIEKNEKNGEKLFAIFPDYITFLPPHLQLTADTIQIGTLFE